jgi:hypothetical protein
VAAVAASSRPLFFPTAFVDLDGEGFILQVHGVLTRIRSGATLEALGGGALGSTTAAARAGSGSGSDLFEMATTMMGEKTLRVLASIYKSNRPSNGQMDKSALG